MARSTLLFFFIGLLLHFSFTTYGRNVMFSNTWTVQIRGGDRVVLGKLARKHGFVNETQIVSNYYTFDQRMVPNRSSSPSNYILEKLLAEPEVLWAEQQALQPYILYSSVTFNDREWENQWYLRRDQDQPTYNVQDVWNMGFTGKGIVVAVVDQGVEKNHPELQQNFDPEASFDFIDNDKDPSAGNRHSVSHGTKCAGVIAAAANNSFCGVGIAYSANISGIRILDKELTDTLKANGLGYKQHYVDIYSNSWGPKDNGYQIADVGVMTEAVLSKGAVEGRKGRGSIFVFAAGNGGRRDCCSFNGLLNSIYTIAITGVNKDGSVARYGERCPGIMAATYSREIFSLFDNAKVITATDRDKCTDSFSASSAAAAMASGLIALTLESNQKLSWRDVQHIIIRSSRADSKILKATDWITNGANLTVSNYVGFGLMDAYRLVSYAKNWTTVPTQLNSTISSPKINRAIPSEKPVTLRVAPINIKFLEHVQVRVTLNFTRRGDLEMDLTSPLGTTSRLIHSRPRDGFTTLTNWTILTLQYWGENPTGVWNLSLKNSRSQRRNTGVLFDWTLLLYGTEADPIKGNWHIHAPLANTPPTTTSSKIKATEAPKAFPDCTKLLGTKASSRTNGYLYKCIRTVWKPYLEIHLNRPYKIIAIATKQGEKWVKPYKIGFQAGSRFRAVYSDAGTRKVVEENSEESLTIVKYQFREPFVTNRLMIYPSFDFRKECFGIKIYGCDPSPDCILVGSLVWGLWSNRNEVSIYYKVYITELTKTHMTLSRKYHYPRRFRRTNSKLIIDEIPEKKEILEKPRVIAPYTYFGPERYKSGRVTYIDTFSVQVTFDDNTKRYFTLRNALAKMRLIRRPSFC